MATLSYHRVFPGNITSCNIEHFPFLLLVSCKLQLSCINRTGQDAVKAVSFILMVLNQKVMCEDRYQLSQTNWIFYFIFCILQENSFYHKFSSNCRQILHEQTRGSYFFFIQDKILEWKNEKVKNKIK